jgi:hypothetical protein
MDVPAFVTELGLLDKGQTDESAAQAGGSIATSFQPLVLQACSFLQYPSAVPI